MLQLLKLLNTCHTILLFQIVKQMFSSEGKHADAIDLLT